MELRRAVEQALHLVLLVCRQCNRSSWLPLLLSICEHREWVIKVTSDCVVNGGIRRDSRNFAWRGAQVEVSKDLVWRDWASGALGWAWLVGSKKTILSG